MTEVIHFPDAEGMMVSYLEPLGVHVGTKVPDPRPQEFIRVVRVGGTRTNLITDTPILTFEVWAATSVRAEELASSARALVGAAEHNDDVSAWVRRVREVVGLQFYPDPETGTPRYQFTVQMDVRGNPL